MDAQQNAQVMGSRQKAALPLAASRYCTVKLFMGRAFTEQSTWVPTSLKNVYSTRAAIRG